MIIIRIIVFFFLSFNVYSKVKKFEVTSSQVFEYSFKEVCLSFNKEALLITSKDSYYLDCMGEKVDVREFCEKKLKARSIPFLRTLSKDQKVLCQGGKTASLSLDCVGKYKGLCRDKLKSCKKLQEVYAKGLILSFAGVSENENESLNCYFLDTEGLDYI